MQNNSFQRFCFRFKSICRYQRCRHLCVDVISDQHTISNRLIYYTIIFGKFCQNQGFPPEKEIFPDVDLWVDVICDQHKISNRLIYYTTMLGKYDQN